MLAREPAVRVELLGAVYRQLPLTLAVVLLNAVLTVVVLAPRVAHGSLAAWLAAMAAMVALRLVAWSRFSPLDQAARAAPHWEWIAAGGALVSGLLWGACGAVLMPPEQPYPLFVAFVVGGMCAGVAAVSAPHLPSVIAYILPAVLPLAVSLAAGGSRLAAVMAAMMVVFAASLIVAAARFSRFHAADVQVRTALAERTRELAAANARLWSEMQEHRETEAALHHAQKMEAIGSLTAGVAHDFNNLLMAISGSAELLKLRLPPPLQKHPQLAAILRATDRGARLTRHLLAFARKDALQPTALDLNAVLRTVPRLLEATLGPSVRVELRLADGLWPVFLDADEIERAIVNLAVNARDAMPEGGTLSFVTENVPPSPVALLVDLSHRPCVRLSVIDTGSGMTEAVRERAFDPFFTTKPVGKGSGLGLSQVYGFVEQSGGKVRIESAAGSGTTVVLLLPRATEEPALPPPPRAYQDQAGQAAPARADAWRPAHIVLLEDDDAVREVVAETLALRGHTVSAFADAAGALRRIAEDPSVAVLVTDLGLPDLSGEQVARIARQQRPALPVLFVTGYNDAAELAGERWQLRKPFAEAALLAMIDAMLGASHVPA